MIKAVIFDLYNTLAYINPSKYHETKQKMARDAGASSDLLFEIWRQYSRDNNRGDILTVEERVARVLRELNISANRALIRQLADYEYELQEKGVELNPVVHDVLYTLKSMNLKLGLITNTGFSTECVVDILDIRKHFDYILLSYKLRVLKPGNHIYEFMCQNLHVEPSECLYIGDGDDSEIEGAMNVGMYAVLLKEAERERISHTKSVPHYDHVIHELGAITSLAKSLTHRE
jgi:putative hydrolase of the HAD superfamily